MVRATLTALALVSMLALPLGKAQAQWRQQVTSQIDQFQERMSESGFRLAEETRTGSLGAGQRESLTATLRSGVEYMILGVCDNDCTDVDLRLYDELGSEVDTDLEVDDYPIVSATPSRSGEYRIEVAMVTCSTEPCFYGVGIFSKGAPATPAAGPAPLGTRYSGELRSGDATLSSGEYADPYSFNVRAGQRIVVDLSSSEFDTYLVLKQPNGNQTDNDDYEGSQQRSRIEEVASESGEWEILVTSYEEGETGTYQLNISVTDAVAAEDGRSRFESGTLASVDQTLPSGEYADVYSFQGRSGEQVVIDLRSSDFDPYLILRMPNKEQQENDDHEGDASRSLLSLTLPQDGRYDITVTSYRPDETGSYDLRIDQEDSGSVAAGPRVEQGSLAKGDETLRTGEYVDVFEFEGRPGQQLQLDLTSTDFDTYVILKDPAGGQSENDDTDRPGHSAIESSLTESGTYRVLVTSYEVGEEGDYELSINLGGAAAATAPGRDVATLAIGGRTSGALTNSDGQIGSGEFRDLYVFDGTAGQSVVVDMTSSDFDTYLSLVTPDGESIDNDDYEGSTSQSRIELTLQDSGRHRILATSYEPGETGSYEISIREPAGRMEAERITRATTGADGQGRIYGVFAGISDYGGRASNLAYTADDAVRVRDALVRGAGMRSGDGIVLTDQQATVAGVRNAVQSMARNIGPEDTFVFFYSGHGSRIPRSDPQPTDPDALDETLELYDAEITDDSMRELLGQVPANRVILLLDACFSGGFSKDVISVPGRMGLFSSEEDVTSSVAAKFRAGGYLAVFLADAIGDHLADADGDGQINAIELSQYVHERYRSDLKSGGLGDFVRTGGPQLGYQHLVVDRGSIGPYEVLFKR
jgi:hypothetical protein